MEKVLMLLNQIVWGIPALVLILGVGVYLSIRTRFAQISLFPKAIRYFLQRLQNGDFANGEVSSYQALCTALAATVGTGNLAGVAGAIAIGGPGAVFWMWICAFFGMITKFAEAALAVRFRTQQTDGTFSAGPMYMISRGMDAKWRWLAWVYCFFGVVASFGVGNATQINAVISGMNDVISFLGGTESNRRNLLLGIGFSVLVAVMLLGGAKRIGKIAEQLVPLASLFYMILCLGVLIARFSMIDDAFRAILTGAFSPAAVTGGAIGSAFQALRVGASRGVFTNEAGLGTAAIAHGTAQVVHPVEQGLMGIMEVFLDTIVICTLTALVILCSGVLIPFGTDAGAALTTAAFSSVYGTWISIPITIALCLFAIATILGWGLYGARCAQFLFGENAWKPFVIVQSLTVIVASVLNTGTVWLMAETVNGLMAIPNLIVLAFLSPELARLTMEYKTMFGRYSACGGTYENINQCKPLRTVSHEKVSSSGGKSGQGRKKDLSFKYRSAGYRNTSGLL